MVVKSIYEEIDNYSKNTNHLMPGYSRKELFQKVQPIHHTFLKCDVCYFE